MNWTWVQQIQTVRSTLTGLSKNHLSHEWKLAIVMKVISVAVSIACKVALLVGESQLSNNGKQTRKVIVIHLSVHKLRSIMTIEGCKSQMDLQGGV